MPSTALGTGGTVGKMAGMNPALMKPGTPRSLELYGENRDSVSHLVTLLNVMKRCTVYLYTIRGSKTGRPHLRCLERLSRESSVKAECGISEVKL